MEPPLATVWGRGGWAPEWSPRTITLFLDRRHTMTTIFRRVGGLLLGALLLAVAAPAQTFNNLYYMGDSPNELTSVKPAFDGGYFASANFPDGAVLVKLKANGDLD